MVDFNLIYNKAMESAANTAHNLYNYIPNILAAVVILIIGIFAAKILKKLTVKILYRFGMGRATRTSGFDSTLKKIGYHGTTIELIGDLIKLLIWLITLALMANALTLGPLVEFFQTFTMFLPRIIAAIFVIVVGAVITDFFARFVKTALTLGTNTRKEKNIATLGHITGNITRIVMYLLLIIIIFNIIGISAVVLDIAFVITLATAAGLVLIGAKEIVPNFIAGLYLQKTYESGDVIKIKDSKGKITNMETLFTQLETKDKKITLPNSMLLNEIVEKEE